MENYALEKIIVGGIMEKTMKQLRGLLVITTYYADETKLICTVQLGSIEKINYELNLGKILSCYTSIEVQKKEELYIDEN